MPQHLSLTYQVATHYLSKIALRIEVLFERINAATHSEEPAVHHLALLHLIELSKLVEKPELKGRFLKELMRFDYTLSKQTPPLPDEIMATLHEQIHLLSHLTHRFGEALHKDPFLQAVYTHQHHHHDIELDPLPLFYWLEQDPQHRINALQEWLQHLTVVYDAVKLYLSIIRHCTPFQAIVIKNGFHQQTVHEKRTCHLIILCLSKRIEWIPKIQVGHYGITISLCDKTTLKESHPVDVQADLAVCVLY
ncbi:MAG: cell division protein ZapD [Gammaproteobacteria bacterium]|nr:cell division protein ZapD [Gammaproteobacteria bacterium]